MGKYQHLTDYQIDEKINSGEFREEGTLIRNASNGETVKVKSSKTPVSNTFPTTFLQVNNTVLYQADLTPVYENIKQSRELQSFSDMEERYNIILDYFDSYITHGDHLSELLTESLQAAAVFENRIRNYIQSLDMKQINSLDVNLFVGSLSAYVNVLFIYILVSFLKYKESFSKDTVIISKIISLRDQITAIYEQLLVESTVNHEGEHILSMRDSVYALYLMDESYNIFDLDDLVKYDRRFNSALDVVNFFKRFNLDVEDYSLNIKKISTKVPRHIEDSNIIKLIDAFSKRLSDLENLENLREEILQVKDNSEVIALVESKIRS
ncbi:hypothetical protein [Vibrio parahaemolyticus]|uniref:hypothetical protein n=1 Tax=Vibrio parahaemolyticus TaxID=670 RepID=UPI00235E05CB|nr:hypothetical protein [Vibrio parahaemolyticus]